jgi:transcriptional regulator with XRE-family HTH domain
MNNVKGELRGRPRRSQTELDLRAIGKRIRQLRGATTQIEFAQSLHISQAQLSKYELGQSALPLGTLVRLSQKSARTIEWILTGKD